MLSPTTIASSTTMPSTSKNAKVDNKFSETSFAGSSAKAPRKLTPIPTVTHSATLGSRVRIKIMKTSSSPMIEDSAIRFIRFSYTSAVSNQTESSMPVGRLGWVSAIHSLTAALALTTCMSSVDMTCSSTAACPSKVARISFCSKSSSTVATSSTLTMPP